MGECETRRASIPHALACLVFAACALVVRPAPAMEVRTSGDQLILSGPVMGDEVGRVQAVLAAAPAVTTVILRDSPGGDAPTGYRLGELFRARGLGTAVSGYCYSSCSRMFLGGVVRRFTDDFPPEHTQVGFHGHYGPDGRLDRAAVDAMGLAAWIIAHSDGKADPALVERWTHIPFGRGLIHFYYPGVARTRGGATFLCQGDKDQGDERAGVFGCETVGRTALDLGVATSLDPVSSNDQAEIRAAVPARVAPSGWAALSDVGKVPLASDQGLDDYRRFLRAPFPRAFAVSASGRHWGWSAGPAEALARALASCRQRSVEACALYALDDAVVWRAGGHGDRNGR